MILRRAVLGLLVPACFHPTYDRPACGRNDACPGELTCNRLSGFCEPPPGAVFDAAIDTPPGPVADARLCFGSGLVKLCLTAPPSNPVSYSGVTTIDTSNAGVCTQTFANPGGPDLCVVAGTTVTVSGTVTAVGMRALVLIASDRLSIQGTLDASSTSSGASRRGAAGNSGNCIAPTSAENDMGGAGGGAGGSFVTRGGIGGTGDLNNSGSPAGTGAGGQPSASQGAPALLRGGCRGGDGGAGDGLHRGRGGDGGGAIYLIAATAISIGGDVFASGAGGVADAGGSGAEQGGGGGGTGGMIGLDAPKIDIQGHVVANGGAGAGGGAINSGGSAGGDGTTINWNARATRGLGAVDVAGNGGDGAPGTAIGQTDSGDGGNSDGGGGGGGGGLGVLWIDGTVTGGAMVSPAPTPH